MDKISVIVPCYNEEKTLPIFYKELKSCTSKIKGVSFEYIFINDGSKDDTLLLIKKYNTLTAFFYYPNRLTKILPIIINIIPMIPSNEVCSLKRTTAIIVVATMPMPHHVAYPTLRLI